MNYDSEYHSCPLHGYRIKDERGCFICIDELRQQEKHQEKEKANYAKRLTQKLKPISSQKAQREAKLSQLRKEKKELIRYCEGCGTTSGILDYSHILSVKQFPKYELHPDNAVIHCRTCHERFEHGSLQDKMRLGNWPQMLNFILKYEPAYFNKLQLRSINKAA